MTKPAAATRSLVVEREMPHPPEKIWRALTQGPLIEEWLMKNDFKPVVTTVSIFAQTGALSTVRPWQSTEQNAVLRGRPMVSRVSSLGLSPLRARGPTCAWSSRASGRISSRPTRAPRAGGRGSLRRWSRSWRG
jgi:hypothetical protein